MSNSSGTTSVSNASGTTSVSNASGTVESVSRSTDFGRQLQWIALVGCALAAGCLSGFSGDGGDGPDPGVTTGPDGKPVGPDGAEVGPRALRRLTPTEYDNTVRDALGLGDDFSAGLSPDRSSALGFDNDSSLTGVDEARAEELEAAAEKLADRVIAAGPQGCGAADRACAATLVERLAPKLFRRAVTDEEKQRYLAAYDEVAKDAPADALRWTLVALFDSPYFLYRFELGDPAGDVFRLTPEELASALSYTFTAGPPSDALLDDARAGALADPEARVAAAKTLLDSPRGHRVLEAFAQRWLRYEDVRNLVKDPAASPDFADVRDDMAEETRRFLTHVLYEQKGGVRELLTSGDTFVSTKLAAHYGWSPPASEFAQVTRPPEQALGLLAQGAILSRFALTHTSSPPQRGAFVRRKLLCQELPSPPPNAGPPPLPQPGLTTRELFEQLHSTSASCAGCHQQLDPVGFGLEAFDTAGKWRTTENGKPIRADGEVYGAGAAGDVPFTDGRDLAQKLAALPEVSACVGGLLSSWAFGSSDARTWIAPADLDALTAGTLGLHDLYARLAATTSFTLRQ